MMEKVFVDTDVMMDLLSQRMPFYTYAAQLFSRADKGSVKLYVSSLSFSNLNYVLSRQYSAGQSRKQLMKFKTLVSVLSVTDKIVELALSSDFKDFEDGMQYYTALENGIKTLLTRNLKDYRAAEIIVQTPEQYLRGRK